MENAITTYEPAMNTQSITTFAEDTVENKLAFVSAVNSATSPTDFVKENGTDVTFVVTNTFTMPGIRKARGAGQVDTTCQNTYLITADGECLMSQSDGIYRSAAAIVAMFPTLDLGDGNEGMRMRVQEKQLKNGNTIKSLVPVQ